MTIVQVLPRYAPAWAFGGGVRMFWMLATELVERGHRLVVVTSDALGPTERATQFTEEIRPGIVVHRFPNPHPWLAAHLTPIFFRPAGMRKGLAALLQSADVVHMGESRGIHNVWAAEACTQARVPLVWSAYGGLAVGAGIRRIYRAAYDLAFTRNVVPRVARFVAQTAHETTVYLRRGARSDRITQIPLCVDLASFQSPPGRGAFRRRLGLSSEAALIVCVARLSPVKGLDTLVDAFSQLEESAGGPHLALVGWDHGSLSSLRSQARRLGVGGRVHFFGPLYGDERLTAYVDADVFALTPRVFEETSLAALEAAACGVPTVLTAECEIPGLVAAGGGIQVARAAPAIAQGLAGLLENPGRRREMGELARQHVHSRFSASAVAAQHETLFRELIA